MRLKVGNPVSGKDFYENDRILRTFEARLESGSFCFVGPRRTGKSSILKHFEQNPPGDFLPVRLDLQKFSTADEWLRQLIDQTRRVLDPELGPAKAWLAKRGDDAFRLLQCIEAIPIPGVGEIKVEMAGTTWSQRFDAFLKIVRDAELPILFLFDEFPYLVDHIELRSKQETRELLQWFRAARLELSDYPVRFVLAGSISLEGYLRRLGLSREINDLDTVEIKPLTNSDAEELICRLCIGESIPISDHTPARIRALLGANWPYHIQLFLSELKEFRDDDDTDEDGEVTPSSGDDLDAVYRHLYSGNRDKYCQEMRDRLSPRRVNDHVPIFTESQSTFARELLRKCAEFSNGIERDTVAATWEQCIPDERVRQQFQDDYDYVLGTLRHDGYLIRGPGESEPLRFASNLLRDFWRHHLG